MRSLSNKWILVILLLLAGAGIALFYWQRPFSTRMAAFVTDLGNRSDAQRVNILRAGRAFSGTVVQPGETFSLNQIAGPYSLDRGYHPERSYLGKQVVFTPGGGVCQVASTLYNAALLSGLEILERVPHSGPVSSVPPGRDAAVAFGVSDLKFRNNHPYPIKILSRVLGNQLLVEIWGKERFDGSAQL